ncbi:MAG: MASE3 domain-containing protein [Desulfohalobiaceae bacterium]
MAYELFAPHGARETYGDNARVHTLLMLGFGTILLVGLFIVSRYNFLLFHTITELFSIAVAWSVFLLVWNIRPYMQNDALFFLGISYLFVGFSDLLHTLAYKGMGVFSVSNSSDFATQLWVSARGIEALVLLLFPLLWGRRIRSDVVMGAFIGVYALILASIFSWNIFPACFREGSGLTVFKIATEYIICLIVLIAIILLYKIRELLDSKVYYYMTASMSLTILAELFFTFYTEVYALPNLIGHYFKIMSFFFIYSSLIHSGLTRPYSLLFKELYQEKEALQESERRHRLLFENAANGVALQEIVLNEQGEPIDYVLSDINPAFEVHTGLSADQVIGRRATEVIPELRNSPFIQYDAQLVHSGGPISFEIYSEQLHRHFSINAYKVDENRFATIFQDTTERKNREKQLQEAKKHAEEASKAKSNFLAKMSHEIRTPMNSILGMLRLVLSGQLHGKQRERIQVAKESAESLLWLLNDLLDLSKVEAGGFTLREKEFRLQRFLNNIFREIEPMAQEKGLELHLVVDGKLPYSLVGDLHRLKRILFNLLTNSIKFTQQGSITLETEQLDAAARSDRDDMLLTTILFRVKDTGCGIDSDQLQSIFGLYDQGGRETLSAEEGTGLGLAICKKFSEQMGGRIWAESTPGEGSTFYVQIPLKTHRQEMIETEPQLQETDNVDLPPQRILLVEDQKMNQLFTTDLLTSHGHRVVVAENGKQALDYLSESSFDLVLMDIWMPVMDGMETTLRIRSADPRIIQPDIPVIGLSAHAVTEKEMESLRNSGFNYYVVKPVNVEDLFKNIQKALGYRN